MSHILDRAVLYDAANSDAK